MIAQVEPGSSAERAGIKRGDVVVAIDGVPIHSATQVRNRVGLKRVGQDVAFTVQRGTQPCSDRHDPGGAKIQ